MTSQKKTPVKVVRVADVPMITTQPICLCSHIVGLVIGGTAENGMKALRLVKEPTPDGVVSDMAMPSPNGIEVLKEIQNDEQSTGIIMGTMDTASHVYGLNAGANVFLCTTDLVALVAIEA
jgi:DNA-binding NarL/FixJ family response regulator